MNIERLGVTKHVISLAAAAATAAALAGVALATPPHNIATAPIVARGGFAEPVDLKLKLRDELEVIHVNGAGETVMQQIVLRPGGHTGWHSHPGPAIAIVMKGELTLYSSDDPTCTGRTYGAGQAFVDSGQGHVHFARNETADDMEVWVTYLDVPMGGAPRIDAADPGICAF